MAPYPENGPAGAPLTVPTSDTTTDVNATGASKKRAPRKPKPSPVTGGGGSVASDEGLRNHKRMALRFAQAYTGQFLHTPGRGWMQFNGAYWEECGESAPWNAVGEICRAALHALAPLGEKARDELYEDVRRCDTASGTAGVLAFAKHWPGIGHRDEQLDAHPELFITRNGTYELGTDTFRPSDPRDLMTLAGSVDYDPGATCPLYDSLMEQYQPDRGVREYLHRLGGAALEGAMNLQQVIINYGATGGNGKGTTQRAWTHVLGTYAHTLDVGALLARKGYDQYRDDKALMKGKRLIYLTEPSAGQKFDTGTVKSLTGGENVTGSQKYRSAVTFPPTWLLMMSTNNRVSTPADGGMARRLKEIGWDYKVPTGTERTDIDDRLRAEGSGILNRLLAGWRDFRDNGIQEPDSVTKATADYLASVDPVGLFLEECVVERTGNNTPSASVYKAYDDWCHDNGEHAMSSKLFSPELEKRGYVKKRTGTGVLWQNTALMASGRDSGYGR